MYIKRPYDDPRAMSLVKAIRSPYNIWGWLLVLSILLVHVNFMGIDYKMMRAAAFETSDYEVTGYDVELRDGSYYVKVHSENQSAEPCMPWILEMKDEDGEEMDLLSAQRYFRYRNMEGNLNPAVEIPPQARGAIIFTIDQCIVKDTDSIEVTFDNLDVTELAIELS